MLQGLLCFNFYRGWRGVTDYYRKYLPDDVSVPQSYILELCSLSQPIYVSQLAKGLEIAPPAISSLLKRMEKSELVYRKIPVDNRRKVCVYLSNKGEKLRNDIRQKMFEADENMSKTIAKEDLEHLISVVDKIRLLGQT